MSDGYQLDEEKVRDLFGEMLRPTRDFMVREMADRGGPHPEINFVVLNAIAMIAGVSLKGCPDNDRERVRKWFDDAVTASIESMP